MALKALLTVALLLGLLALAVSLTTRKAKNPIPVGSLPQTEQPPLERVI